jgi:hypothetical protein
MTFVSLTVDGIRGRGRVLMDKPQFLEDMFNVTPGEGYPPGLQQLSSSDDELNYQDLNQRLIDVEMMLQIQQEQIEVINKIFQKVFAGIDIDSIEVNDAEA